MPKIDWWTVFAVTIVLGTLTYVNIMLGGI